MATVVIDASITSAWCFPDEQTEYTEAIFQAVFLSNLDAVAPPLWAYEIRNSILMGLRRGRISKADCEQFFDALDALDVRLVEPVSYDDLFSLAEQHRLTVYDAAYLNLALRERLALATLDGQLVRAAQDVGIELLKA